MCNFVLCVGLYDSKCKLTLPLLITQLFVDDGGDAPIDDLMEAIEAWRSAITVTIFGIDENMETSRECRV